MAQVESKSTLETAEDLSRDNCLDQGGGKNANSVPLFSLTAIHECLFHIHDRLTASQYLALDVLEGKGDCSVPWIICSTNKEGSGAIRRVPCTSLRGEVLC